MELMGPRLSHRESHRPLLRSIPDSPFCLPDAIVVPTSRPVHYLTTAADLTARLNCVLVVLCSIEARAADFATLAGEWPDLRWAAIDVPAGYQHALLEFATAGISDVKVGRLGDLSVKRNLALLLARLLGWQSMLLLDDDIYFVDETSVRRGTAALDRLAMVGLVVSDYPDNSVVCHANRLSGRPQNVFISGSALLVNCKQLRSFFPEIYNEDWLFLYDNVASQTVTSTGIACQLAYDPFADPARAASEEFGDVIAEGLFTLLHDSCALATALSIDFWRHFLLCRQRFIADIAHRLDVSHVSKDIDIRNNALVALRAAEARRSSITATSCVAYLRTWQADRLAWIQRLDELGRSGSLSAAVETLGLHEYLHHSDSPVRTQLYSERSLC